MSISKKALTSLLIFVLILLGSSSKGFGLGKNADLDSKTESEDYSRKIDKIENIRKEKRTELLQELNISDKDVDLLELWKETRNPKIVKYFEDCLGFDDGKNFGAKEAANVLAVMNTKESKEALVRGMGRYKGCRGYCAVILSTLGEIEKYGPIIVEEKAYEYCRGKKELIPYVEKGLKDEDPDARSMAVNILLYYGDDYRNQEELKKTNLELLKSSSPEARWRAAIDLYKSMKKEAMPYIKEALKDYPLPRKNKKYDIDYSIKRFQQLINDLERREGINGK